MPYFHEDEARKKLKKDLLTTQAETIAKSFCDTQERRSGEPKSTLGTSQIRKWYDEVKRLTHQITTRKSQPDFDFEMYLGLMKQTQLKISKLLHFTSKPFWVLDPATLVNKDTYRRKIL